MSLDIYQPLQCLCQPQPKGRCYRNSSEPLDSAHSLCFKLVYLKMSQDVSRCLKISQASHGLGRGCISRIRRLREKVMRRQISLLYTSLHYSYRLKRGAGRNFWSQAFALGRTTPPDTSKPPETNANQRKYTKLSKS